MLPADEYRQAEFGYTLAESRRGFKIHAAVYAIAMAGLTVLNTPLWVYNDRDVGNVRGEDEGTRLVMSRVLAAAPTRARARTSPKSKR